MQGDICAETVTTFLWFFHFTKQRVKTSHPARERVYAYKYTNIYEYLRIFTYTASMLCVCNYKGMKLLLTYNYRVPYPEFICDSNLMVTDLFTVTYRYGQVNALRRH